MSIRFWAYSAIAAISSMGVFSSAIRADWVAGRDFSANELGATPLTDPNSLVPAWSYGYRSVDNATSLNLYSAGNHLVLANGLRGWSLSTGPNIEVNTTAGNVTTNFGPGNNIDVLSKQMLLHPSQANDYGVVRWTAPAAGVYDVTASWIDIDFHGGNGATGEIVLNGSVIFTSTFKSTSLTTQGTATYSPHTLTLALGDKLDFLTGSNGEWGFDSTGFDATISDASIAAPLPGPLWMSLALLPLAMVAMRFMLPVARVRA